MSVMVIDIPSQTRERLEAQARRMGKSVETLACELIATALAPRQEARPTATREVLQAANRTRLLSAALQRKIIPDVSLTEVRQSLTQAAGPALSGIILEQRGSKPPRP